MVTHSVRNLGVQVDAEMTIKSHVTTVCRSEIFHLRKILRIRQYLTAAATCMCHKLTRCWQSTALSTASEVYTTASESTELGSPLGRRRHEILPYYTAADEVALAADSSVSRVQDPATHTSSTDWPRT